jgi:hypothetical protein
MLITAYQVKFIIDSEADLTKAKRISLGPMTDDGAAK